MSKIYGVLLKTNDVAFGTIYENEKKKYFPDVEVLNDVQEKKIFQSMFDESIEKYTESVSFDNNNDFVGFLGKNLYYDNTVRFETSRLLNTDNTVIYEMIYTDFSFSKQTMEKMMKEKKRNSLAEFIGVEGKKVFGNVFLLKTKKVIPPVSDSFEKGELAKYLYKKFVTKCVLIKPNGEYKQYECVLGPSSYFGDVNGISFFTTSFCEIAFKYFFIKHDASKEQRKKYSLNSVNKVATRVNSEYTIYGDVLMFRMASEYSFGDFEIKEFKKILDLSWGKAVAKENIVIHNQGTTYLKKSELKEPNEIDKKLKEKEIQIKNIFFNVYETLEENYQGVDQDKLKKYLEKKYICCHCFRLRYESIEEMEKDTEHVKWCVENKKPANEIVKRV